ncbi:MAG: HlyC/CorC family transporter [Ruminococcaceae bacterium]|nr:HlyC/CorC family transporter [Oscillospiraceae bacterium]
MFKHLLLQFILIALNAFFAATEIAVISLNEKKIKAQAEDGDKKAEKMLKMIENPTRFLSTIQIGITLAGFLGSAFAADNFAEKLSMFLASKSELLTKHSGIVNDISVIVITLILSFFTLVLGELVPKRVAMRHKEKLSYSFCGIISFLTAVLRPIIWLLTVSTNGMLRIFGIDPNEKEDSVSEEDIVLMLDAGADEGSLNQDDIEYIKNVFKLDRMTAEDVMTPRNSVVFVSKESSDEELLTVIENEGYSRIPVYSESHDNIVGILYTKDYLLHKNDENFSIDDAIQPPVFVPESIHLDTLFKDMQTDHNHIVMVVNEYGETSGIVTMEDILEEIVGEIWDESDEAVDDFTPIDEENFKVLCSVSIEDFFEYFSLEFDEETEAATVNGWLTQLGEGIPAEGDTFEFNGISITVTKANDMMAQEITVNTSGREKEEIETED